MALTYRLFYLNNHFFRNITKPVRWSCAQNFHPVRILSSGICYENNFPRLSEVKRSSLSPVLVRPLSSDSSKPAPPEGESKPGLVQRLKQMYRDYWYVVVPVHMAASAMWFGGFYYIVQSGVDVVGLLESLGVSETLLSKFRDSSAGHVALTLALYKVISPLRYAFTLGVTTLAIRRLTAVGWIKPVPSRERMKEMWSEKKDDFHQLQDRFHESKQRYQTQMKEKRTSVMEEMRKYREDIKTMKSKMKKMNNGPGSGQGQ